MEQVANIITWKEVSKEYLLNINDCNIQVMIYNPLTSYYNLEHLNSKNCVVYSKHASNLLRYYILVEGY